MASLADHEMILWKKEKESESEEAFEWKQQFMFPISCKPVQVTHQDIAALIYNNKLRLLTRDVIKQFTEEFGTEEDEESYDKPIKSDSKAQFNDDHELQIKGPLNVLFPKILQEL